MDKQKVFNDVATHLLTQGERAVVKSISPYMGVETTRCVYRGPNGLKCAIGALIPDELYDPVMEGDNASASSLKKFHDFIRADCSSHFTDDAAFLQQLQRVHDDEMSWTSSDTVKNRLRIVASRHKLDPSILDTITLSLKWLERDTAEEAKAAVAAA